MLILFIILFEEFESFEMEFEKLIAKIFRMLHVDSYCIFIFDF